MTELSVNITGVLVGRRLDPRNGSRLADIVHIDRPPAGTAPAENAFVLVETNGNAPRARYISWINYFDIEYAARRESGEWILVEPGKRYHRRAKWHPYGWERTAGVPTIGDATLARMARQHPSVE
jgi:hypothetical protein